MVADTFSPIARRYLRRNYTLGIINGAIFGFVDAMSAPSLVLALFVAQLGGSNLLIGLLPAIYDGGWYLPQLLVSHRLQQLPLQKRAYVPAAVVRIVCWALIAALTPIIGASNPPLLLTLFFVLLTTYSLMAGVGGNAFMTIIAKTIPPARRASFFGLRELTGTAAGLLAGYLVAAALSPERGLNFPTNFGILFLIDFGAIALGLTIFAQVIEPKEVISSSQVTLMQQLRAAGHLWRRDVNFQRYLLTRAILAAGGIATPFYAIYATRALGAGSEIAGLYIGVTTVSALLSNPVWSWISDRRGSRSLIIAAPLSAMLMPLIALAFGILGKGSNLAVPFSLVFLSYGVGRTAGNIVFPTYLLNIAPPAERSLYIGLTNTLLGIATFIPAIGGILLDLFGFELLFVLTLLISAVGLLLGIGLHDPG